MSIQKRIEKFINDTSTLEDGNPGYVPGYFPEIESQIHAHLESLGISEHQAKSQIMSLVNKALNMQHGYEETLEELAKDIIYEHYGAILNGVKLDIQLVRPGQPKDQMDDDQESENPSIENIEDEDLKNEIYKRRMCNDITQGAALNSHRMLHIPSVVERLSEVHPELKNTYDLMIKCNEVFDATTPIEAQLNMWRAMPEGMAGTVKVEWEEDDNEDGGGTPEANNEDDNGDDEGLDLHLLPEEKESSFSSVTPVIKARGIDFVMLVHETIKGIYELIMANGIPKDEETAQIVIQNSDTFEQEMIGFRVGKQLRADLMYVINKHKGYSTIDNFFEFFLGELVQLPASEFLKFVNDILSENETSYSKVIKSIGGTVVNNVKEWDEYLEDTKRYNDHVNSSKNKDEQVEEPKVEEENKEIDYSKMTKSELNNVMNKALSNRDFAILEKIKKYL